MIFIKLIWKVIWNIKSIFMTTVFLTSLGLNFVLFTGGSLHTAVNDGFETLTGRHTIASRNKAEIAKLGEEIMRERIDNREIRGQLSKAEINLSDVLSAKNTLESASNLLGAKLFAQRQLNSELSSQLADLSRQLAAVKRLCTTKSSNKDCGSHAELH